MCVLRFLLNKLRINVDNLDFLYELQGSSSTNIWKFFPPPDAARRGASLAMQFKIDVRLLLVFDSWSIYL